MTIVGRLTTAMLLMHVSALTSPTVLELELADRLRTATEEIEVLTREISKLMRGRLANS